MNEDYRENRENRHTQFGLRELDKQPASPEAAPLYKPSQHNKRFPVKPLVPYQHPRNIAATIEEADTEQQVAPLNHKFRSYPSLPPWKYLFDLKIAAEFHCVVALTDASPPRDVLIQKMKKERAQDQLRMITRIRHENFVEKVEAFVFGDSYCVAWAFMPLSLVDIATHPVDDQEMASILGQVLKGLLYLHKEGLEHGSLSCSNVLADYTGGHENSRKLTQDGDRRGMICLTMWLVNRHRPRDTSRIAIHDHDQMVKMPLTWSFLQFLDGGSHPVSEMLEQPLFKTDWGPQYLRGKFWIAHFFSNFVVHRPADLGVIQDH